MLQFIQKLSLDEFYPKAYKKVVGTSKLNDVEKDIYLRIILMKN